MIVDVAYAVSLKDVLASFALCGASPENWPIHDEEYQIGDELGVLSRIDAVRLKYCFHLFSTFKEFLHPIVHRASLRKKKGGVNPPFRV